MLESPLAQTDFVFETGRRDVGCCQMPPPSLWPSQPLSPSWQLGDSQQLWLTIAAILSVRRCQMQQQELWRFLHDYSKAVWDYSCQKTASLHAGT